MKFISAEEFLKQDKKVQTIFLNWWKPNIGDIIYVDGDRNYLEEPYIDVIVDVNKKGMYGISEYLYEENDVDIIPLLTEGQLRQFIEDKTECFVSLLYSDEGYEVITGLPKNFVLKTDSAIEAYWKVAVEIAKEFNDKIN